MNTQLAASSLYTDLKKAAWMRARRGSESPDSATSDSRWP